MEHTHEHTNHNASQGTHHKKLSWFTSNARALEELLAPMLDKAPHLPADWKNVLVSIVPWISIIFGVLGIIGFLGASSLGVVLSPLIALERGLGGITVFITIVLGLIVSILSILAFKPLQAMSKTGWDYIYYGFIISTISTALSLLMLPGAGAGAIIGVLIGTYLLFEIRGRYH